MAIPGIEVTERPWTGSADSRTFARDPGPGNPYAGSETLRSPTPQAPPPPQPGMAQRLRGAYGDITGRNFVGPMPQPGLLARGARTLGGAAGVAAGAAEIIPNALEVSRNPNSTGIDVATQVAGDTGKIAAGGAGALMGAKAGATLGAFAGPVGAFVGGAAGGIAGGAAGYYGAGEATKSLRGAIPGPFSVADPRDPLDQVRDRQTLQSTAPGAPALASQPLNPTDQRLATGAQATPTAADQSGIRRIDRPGQSPLFTNVPDGGMFGNDTLMARGQVSAQNMAAADALAGSEQAASTARVRAESLRNQAPANDPRSILLRQLSSGKLNKNGAAILAQLASSDASVRSAEIGLRGNMYSADQRLAAEQAGFTIKGRQAAAQRQVMGQFYQAAGGDWAKAARLAAAAGLDPKTFMEQASAEQALGEKTAEQARKPFEASSVTRDKDGNPTINPALVAQHEAVANQITGGKWQNMPAPERAGQAPKVVAATKMLNGMNTLRSTGWGQAVGLDDPTPELSQIPNLRGASMSRVGLWDAATTPKVSKGDYKLSSGLRDYYIPNDAMSEQTLRFMEENGVKRQK